MSSRPYNNHDIDDALDFCLRYYHNIISRFHDNGVCDLRTVDILMA